jgi:hypothetical protein
MQLARAQEQKEYIYREVRTLRSGNIGPSSRI